MTQIPEIPAEDSSKARGKFSDPLPWIVMVTALVLDQLTKWIVIETLAVGESWPETGLLRFTHAWNTGTAFSLFQGHGDILTWVSLGAVGVLTWIYRSLESRSWVLKVAFGMQFGGAIGNIIDRIRLGHVTDFLDVGWWPVFNIADSSIVVGIGLMVFYFWFLNGNLDGKKEQSTKANTGGNETVDSEIRTTSTESKG